MRFYAQLNDGNSMNKTADRMEIVDDGIRVYSGDQLVGYLDLSTVLYAHLCA